MQENKYHTGAIITRSLYIFYPIFNCGLYCRAAHNAERLIFHDYFCSFKHYNFYKDAIQFETKDTIFLWYLLTSVVLTYVQF